ncbi:hypothetical protein [Gallaecimonas sp. GXIMD4217]|uniref:hypothetical protein n=1 Tax=Gallaecimonas sp. GXIMD4217 TaxID=3131927 RepID=UPI00311AFF89
MSFKSRHYLLLALLALAALPLLLTWRTGDDGPKEQAVAPAESQEASPVEVQQAPEQGEGQPVGKPSCLPAEQYRAFLAVPANRAVIEDWLWQLGLYLPARVAGSDQRLYEQHPHFGFSLETIEALAEQDDPDALQTLGLLRRWQAFGKALPQPLLAVYADDAFSMVVEKGIDAERFSRSNELLLRAAALGRVEALGEIAFNHYYRHLLLKATNPHDVAALAEAKRRQLAYDRLRQVLVPELHQLFAMAPDAELAAEVEKLAARLAAELRAEMAAKGTVLPRPPGEYLIYQAGPCRE